LPSVRPAFFGLVLLGLFGLGNARFHLVRHALDLLLAQCALNCKRCTPPTLLGSGGV